MTLQIFILCLVEMVFAHSFFGFVAIALLSPIVPPPPLQRDPSDRRPRRHTRKSPRSDRLVRHVSPPPPLRLRGSTWVFGFTTLMHVRTLLEFARDTLKRSVRQRDGAGANTRSCCRFCATASATSSFLTRSLTCAVSRRVI
jgi:hypothetical protein